MLEILLLVLIFASWLYWLVACWMVRTFFQSQPEPKPDFAPPVSILKPVRGLDFEAYRNFASFCQQDYPRFEILFGVANPADPVIPVIARLQQGFPQNNIRLIVAPAIESNRKASLLHHLANQASHEVLVVSDSDMRVTPDYLRRVVAPLADAQIGLVTCLYRGALPLTLSAHLEALHMSVTFLPSAIVARRFLSMRFALGATLALRHKDLTRLGGFAAIAEYLADDYQVGARIADLGLDVHLSDYVIASVLGATTFRDQWHREVRWARCSRISRPKEYSGLILTFSTPLAIALILLSDFESLGWLALFGSLLLRWLVAWLVTGYVEDYTVRRRLLWLPVRDMLSALVWCASGVGRRIVWRGEAFILQGDGRMQPEIYSLGSQQMTS